MIDLSNDGKLLQCAKAIVDLVEKPPGYGTQRNADGVRLKDQDEWVLFYNAVHSRLLQVPTGRQSATTTNRREIAEWQKHAPLPWSVDDDDPKCVRDRSWTVVVDLATGNDESDWQLARMIVAAANASASGDLDRPVASKIAEPCSDEEFDRHNQGASPHPAPWSLCPSAHCERSQECRSPNDCIVRSPPKATRP